MNEEHNPYAAPASAVVDPADDSGESLAGRGERLAAALIDGVIALAVMFPLMYLGGYWTAAMQAGARGEQIPISQQLLWAGIGFAVFVLIQGIPLQRSAQTWGKRMLGIRIVDLQGGRPTLFHLLTARYLPVHIVNLLPVLNILGNLVNLLLIFRQDRRCGHDLIAKTRVVKVR